MATRRIIVRFFTYKFDSDFRNPSETIQPVAQAHDGMFPDHARTGIAHHHPDLLAARGLITMDWAIRASRLFRAEPAAIQPHVGVVQKLPAFPTNSIHRCMMVPAMDANHRFHCFPFAV